MAMPARSKQRKQLVEQVAGLLAKNRQKAAKTVGSSPVAYRGPYAGAKPGLGYGSQETVKHGPGKKLGPPRRKVKF